MPFPGAKSSVVLVPGWWLGSWAWDEVADRLRADGHEVAALTMPGLESPDAPRAGIRLADHVEAVVAALRTRRRHPAVLVAHSGAGPVATGAVNAVPELVSRVVYVDSGPAADGFALRPDLPPDVVEIPLPGWTELEAQGSSLEGLDARRRDEFRRRAVPHPAGPARDPLVLHGTAHFRVPTTLVTCTVRPSEIRGLARSGHPVFAVLTELEVSYRDLPTGHWPMWSQPRELGEILLQEAAAQATGSGSGTR